MMRQHLTVVTPSRTQMRPALSHAIPREHRSTTPQRPHDSKGSVSNSEMLSWELHATFARLHPLWSITPDQWVLHPIRTGALLTDRVHALIDDKLYCGCASYAEWTPRLNPIPHTDTPAKAAYLTPEHRPRGTCVTAQRPFHQSTDPLSKDNRISGIFGEWVCGLTQATAGNHYAPFHWPVVAHTAPQRGVGTRPQ